MTRPVRELDRLLVGEIERRLPLLLQKDTPAVDLRGALHSLKGSAGLAGYPELALVIGQASARLRAGDRQAGAELEVVLTSCVDRLSAGKPPFATEWPEPPPGLCASKVEPLYLQEYRGATRDRLGQIDAVLASDESALLGLEKAQRAVHAMKGAAFAVGDDVTAWYCHGLEASLRAAQRTERSARDVLVELGRHRALIASIASDSARGLSTLTALAAERARERDGAGSDAEGDGERIAPASSPSSKLSTDVGLRIPEGTLDRFLERLDRVDRVHDELGRASHLARRVSGRLREVRANLLDALRLLGPPRPWGPALSAVDRIETAANALRGVMASTERGAVNFRQNADLLRNRSDEMRRELLALRRTTMGWLFERVAHAAHRLAEAESKSVRIVIAGGDVSIDRALSDTLYDALIQLVRNGIAHGIDRTDARTRRGKPARGTLWLKAERRGEWLRITVEDDGQGADVERIRELAVRRGALSPERAALASERELLALLFLPGMTTQDDPGLLAGRGIGLDLVQEAARRLGGSVRLEPRAEGGISATFEILSEQALLDVLWVEEGGHELALPVSFTRGVRASDPDRPSLRLGACLGRGSAWPAPVEVELSVYGVEPIALGVDKAGVIEEVTLRPLPPLLAASGPFTGAILRSDGSLRLALDAPVLAARAWAAS